MMATEFYVLALTFGLIVGFTIWFAKNKVIDFTVYRLMVWCLLGFVVCLLVWIFALLLVG